MNILSKSEIRLLVKNGYQKWLSKNGYINWLAKNGHRELLAQNITLPRSLAELKKDLKLF